MAEIETRLVIGGERSAGDGGRREVENPYPYGSAEKKPDDGAGA